MFDDADKFPTGNVVKIDVHITVPIIRQLGEKPGDGARHAESSSSPDDIVTIYPKNPETSNVQ